MEKPVTDLHTLLSEELYQALKEQTTVPPLTGRGLDLTIDDAYAISTKILAKRQNIDGEVIIGKKIGITSEPVQSAFNVNQPDFGFLTNTMEFPDGATIDIASTLIQPKAEAEIGFRLRADLLGPGVTEAQVLDATEAILPCFEVVDSRIADWAIKIEDTIADNASCGVFVLGKKFADPRQLDLPNLAVSVFKNGQQISEGLGSAVQGNPLTAVAWLANTLGEFGIGLKAGEIILSGSLVPLEPVVAGDEMTMELHGVGSTSVTFV